MKSKVQPQFGTLYDENFQEKLTLIRTRSKEWIKKQKFRGLLYFNSVSHISNEKIDAVMSAKCALQAGEVYFFFPR